MARIKYFLNVVTGKRMYVFLLWTLVSYAASSKWTFRCSIRTRSANCPRMELMKCIGINHRETCCDICSRIDNNMCKCIGSIIIITRWLNVSKSSCYIDYATCIVAPTVVKVILVNIQNYERVLNTSVKKSINCEAVEKWIFLKL